jgi:hypothetical protein
MTFIVQLFPGNTTRWLMTACNLLRQRPTPDAAGGGDVKIISIGAAKEAAHLELFTGRHDKSLIYGTPILATSLADNTAGVMLAGREPVAGNGYGKSSVPVSVNPACRY